MTGRNVELRYLEQIYRQEGNQLLVLYGAKENKYRDLLRAFCRGKEYFYYYAPETSADAQLQRMWQEISSYCKITGMDGSYGMFFAHAKSRDGSKLVLAVDEFQHIWKKDPSFWDGILEWKKHKEPEQPTLILLCSTSIPWVEQEIPKLSGASLKKIDRILKIEELHFLDLVREFPGYTLRQSVEVYGVAGGMPEYLERWEKEKGIRYNICTHILSEDGFLYGKARERIRGQLRELSVYQTILEVLASGKRKLNDIYQATGFSRAKISVYLKHLMEFDVVEKVYSFETGGWQNAQKGLYQIKDTYLNFWFKFVYPHMSDLFGMRPEEFYDLYIAQGLDSYLKRYFVKVCMEYLELQDMAKKLPLQIHKMGTWVGKKGNIDIIAQNSVRENIICLCSWSEQKMTFEMCQRLFTSMEQAKVTANFYYLFSANGFEEDLKEIASQEQRIILVDMGEM